MADDGGLARFQRRLLAIPQRVTVAVRPALVQQANEMASTMRRLAPKESGALAGSIEVMGPDASTAPYRQASDNRIISPETTAAVIAGGEKAPHALHVEYGTQKMHAEPFFWPAVRMQRKKAKAAIKRAVSQAVKKGWGK